MVLEVHLVACILQLGFQIEYWFKEKVSTKIIWYQLSTHSRQGTLSRVQRNGGEPKDTSAPQDFLVC